MFSHRCRDFLLFFKFDEISFRPSGIINVVTPMKKCTCIPSMYRELYCLWWNWSCVTVATENLFVIFASPCLRSLCSCSKNRLDTTSDVCSPVITPVCSFCRLIHRLLGFCGSYVIKKCHRPQLDSYCFDLNLVTLHNKRVTNLVPWGKAKAFIHCC